MQHATLWLAALAAALVVGTSAVAQQNFNPPAPKPPDKETNQAILDRLKSLEQAISALNTQGVRDPVLAGVEIYRKAAAFVVRHNEFFADDSGKQVVAALDRGLQRATLAGRGDTAWLSLTGTSSVRAYRSRVDGSLQPYAVTLPADYGKARGKEYRLDIVLHGRANSLTEVKFLNQFANRPAPKEQTWAQIDIFGRGNNAYRWAGEADVYEAIDHFFATEASLGRGEMIDRKRVVLRGFSMGGAGTWHLGLHRPDRWCVLGPGAGFTITKGYAAGLPDPMPTWQDKCLHIYDAVDYAANVAAVPVVAYSGAEDKQIAAARNIEDRLKGTGLSITHLVAPGLEHKFPPDWQKKAEAEYSKYAGEGKGRSAYPDSVAFTTWTLKYPACDWVELLALNEHYTKATVTAKRTPTGYEFTTANVRTLRFTPRPKEQLPASVTIDGKEVALGRLAQERPTHVHLERIGDAWQAVSPQKGPADRERLPRKIRGLTGPIDDAFTDAFLCVKPTGEAWHTAPARYAAGDLERFRAEWSRFFRGDLPVKDDVDVTADDIASRHLILFGDPSSNSLLGKVVPRLPLTWTKDKLELAGVSGDPATHVPALIYPNPLNPSRYVVVNSGHTFHTEDYLGTNARLYPRLGDFALLKLAPTAKDPLGVETATAGLFDDEWRVPAKK